MDRTMLRGHLAKAKEHVASGEEHVRRQRELVAELQRDGHDVTEAKKLLVRFEQLLTMHKEDRDRLEKELAAHRDL